MVREILTTPPTDWVSSLEKVYARQAKQLAEHQANLRQRDKEEVKVSELESVPKTFEKLAAFSGSVRKLQYAQGKAEEKKEEKASIEVQARVAEYGPTTEWYKNYDESYKAVSKDIKNDHQKYLKALEHLQKTFPDNPEMYSFMKGLSGYEEVKFRQLIARQVLKSTYGESAYLGSLDHAGTTEYLGFDGPSKLNAERTWQYKQIGHLNLSDEFIVSELGTEIHKQNTTRKNTKKTQTLVRIAEDEETKWTTEIEAGDTNQAIAERLIARRTYYENLYGEKGRTPEGLTATQAASNDVAETLRKLQLDDSIEFNIHGLNKYLAENIDHPAGKDNHVYFSKEQVTGMVSAGVLGEGKKLLRHVANRNSIKEQLTNDLITPGSGMTPEKKAATILTLKGMGASTEEINKLESINTYAQTKEIFTSTVKEWITDNPLKTINASEAELSSIENINAQILIRERKNQLKTADTELGIITDITPTVMGVSKTLPWPTDNIATATGVAGEIALDLNNKGKILRAQMVWKAFDTDGDLKGDYSKTINTVASDYITNIWNLGGGGVTSGGNGIYAFDKDTESFKNYIQRTRDISTLGDTSNYTADNYANWTNKAALISKNKEGFLKSNEALFNKEDFQHTFIFNDATDRMEYLRKLFPDKTLSELIARDLKIHQNNPDADSWVQSLNLEKLNNYKKSDKAIKFINEGLLKVLKLQDSNGFTAISITDTMRLISNTDNLNDLDPVQLNRIVNLYTESLEDNFEISEPVAEVMANTNAKQASQKPIPEDKIDARPYEYEPRTEDEKKRDKKRREEEALDKWGNLNPSVETDVTNLTKDYG